MFTGIISSVGKIKEVLKTLSTDGLVLTIQSRFKSLSLGESISVDGVCLTVIKKKRIKSVFEFSVELSQETILKTNFRNAKIGTEVNLERALRPIDRMGGHFVQGHVDGTGELLKVEGGNNSKSYSFSYPLYLKPFLVSKGSIALNGISLTIVEIKNDRFTVSILPFTETNTSLLSKKIGDKFNIEADIVAKIISKQFNLLKGNL